MLASGPTVKPSQGAGQVYFELDIWRQLQKKKIKKAFHTSGGRVRMDGHVDIELGPGLEMC